MAIETLRPTEVAIQLYRGQDCKYTFTVLETINGVTLPKDMSAFVALVPIMRLCDKPLSQGGQVPGTFPQPQITNGNEGTSLGYCVWLNGGVGGQIEAIIPELTHTNALWLGTKLATGALSGVFDIQCRRTVDLTVIGSANAAYTDVQCCIRGTWSMDKEVTNL